MLNDRSIRVGAAQTFPELFDLRGTIEKTVEWIQKAGAQGLDLVVFPESFVSGYPYWRGTESMNDSVDYLALMQENAIEIGSQEIETLRQAAEQYQVNCVIGINELDQRKGALTLYNGQVVISRSGKLIKYRRKLMPTHSERVYWGRGSKEDIFVCELDVARVGALICYEHHLGLLSAAMGTLGEEVHCAVWPGWWELERHLGDKKPTPDAKFCDIEPITRAYAIQNGTFVVSCCPYAPSSIKAGRWSSAYANHTAIGGSSIINPSGVYIRPPSFDSEELIWADINLKERREAKAFFDSCGHFSRYDILRLDGQEELAKHVVTEEGPGGE